ncbi:MAG: hypothetical protein H6Q72_4695 [Firmicutes bacterium]|nr:hypothetical protein [Bacillota bacterium]
MKKLAILTVLLLTLLQTVAFAYTTAEVFPKDNEKRYYSVGNHLACFECLNYIKIVKLNDLSTSYLISASSNIDPTYSYSKQEAEIRIDGTTYNLQIGKTTSLLEFGIPSISVTVNVPPDITDKINAANEVSIRFYRYNRYPDEITLPPEYLDEWKKVIKI